VGYIEDSRKAVLLALVIAEDSLGRPVTVREVIKHSDVVESPVSEISEDRSGGWSVFDFSDRVSKHLRTLVRQGLAGELKKGKMYHYYSLVGRGRLDMLGRDLLSKPGLGTGPTSKQVFRPVYNKEGKFLSYEQRHYTPEISTSIVADKPDFDTYETDTAYIVWG